MPCLFFLTAAECFHAYLPDAHGYHRVPSNIYVRDCYLLSIQDSKTRRLRAGIHFQVFTALAGPTNQLLERYRNFPATL